MGLDWTATHSEAVSRLDREEPIWWFVARNECDRQDSVRMGESAYYSGLYVDDDNILRKVEPALTAATFKVHCDCCTHTFNGDRVASTQYNQRPLTELP